jgi:hypothetical protein
MGKVARGLKLAESPGKKHAKRHKVTTSCTIPTSLSCECILSQAYSS